MFAERSKIVLKISRRRNLAELPLTLLSVDSQDRQIVEKNLICFVVLVVVFPSVDHYEPGILSIEDAVRRH